MVDGIKRFASMFCWKSCGSVEWCSGCEYCCGESGEDKSSFQLARLLLDGSILMEVEVVLLFVGRYGDGGVNVDDLNRAAELFP